MRTYTVIIAFFYVFVITIDHQDTYTGYYIICYQCLKIRLDLKIVKREKIPFSTLQRKEPKICLKSNLSRFGMPNKMQACAKWHCVMKFYYTPKMLSCQKHNKNTA